MRPCHKYVVFDPTEFTREKAEQLHVAYAHYLRVFLGVNAASGADITSPWDACIRLDPHVCKCKVVSVDMEQVRGMASKVFDMNGALVVFTLERLDYDYEAMQANMAAFRRELLSYVMHPRFINKFAALFF
jgi:hypothetical protein